MSKSPTKIDRLVGKRIRIFRIAKGLTQADLANAIGVRFQTVQKYESGTSRIAAGRLLVVAELVDVPVSRFLEAGANGTSISRKSPLVTDLLTGPYAVRMLQAFSKISDASVRRTLSQLVESIAGRRNS
jgi:transcriptional regulator with XRE-family HTH domain